MIELIELSLNNEWYNCKKIILNFFKIRNLESISIILKQLASNILLTEVTQKSKKDLITNFNYIRKNTNLKNINIEKNKFIN